MSRAERRGHVARLRWLEWALLSIGVTCVASSGLAWLQASAYQREERRALERILAGAPPPGIDAQPELAASGVIGWLDIPRLGMSAVVAEGDDPSTLSVAVGHLPDTVLPWEAGNSALAAHRDTFFRPLKDIRPGDELRLTTRRGELLYRVREATVVEPDDLSVLEPTATPTLTLITCYPFTYIGRAPKRFIVKSERVAAPQTAASQRPAPVTATGPRTAGSSRMAHPPTSHVRPNSSVIRPVPPATSSARATAE